MSVKKLDYNGLQTLMQTIIFYINKYVTQILSGYLHLSGGKLTGDIVFTPNEANSPDGPGVFSVSRWGTKGTYPSSGVIKYFTGFVARDTSSLSSNVNECRYGVFESALTDSGDSYFTINAYKNEANDGSAASLDVHYPASGSAYTKANCHIILSSGIELY